MILPFGLKQKPLPHYIEHGLIKFNMREGIMHYTIIMIQKPSIRNLGINAPLHKGIVKTKEELDKLLKIRSVYELHTIG